MSRAGREHEYNCMECAKMLLKQKEECGGLVGEEDAASVRGHHADPAVTKRSAFLAADRCSARPWLSSHASLASITCLLLKTGVGRPRLQTFSRSGNGSVPMVMNTGRGCSDCARQPERCERG